jgi:geranylgeranyl diphosphate synthase, type II
VPQPLAPELEEWVRVRRADVDALLDARLAAPADGDPGRLIEAMRYSLLAPGKRVRPLLAIAAAEAVGSDPGHVPGSPVLLACSAVELVHCYSLVHDDLPAMDDDDFRRGRPSNHKAFGEATAILVGDALLTLAFQWIAEGGVATGAAAAYLRASEALARGAGMRGMVRGQARDLGEQPPADIGGLERLHLEKTAALFRAALEVGAAVGGAGAAELEALGRFGEEYGVAFQHADDFDDADHPQLAAAARERLVARVAAAVASVTPLGPRGGRLVGLARALLPPPPDQN